MLRLLRFMPPPQQTWEKASDELLFTHSIRLLNEGTAATYVQCRLSHACWNEAMAYCFLRNIDDPLVD